ncbi:hypothetical protein B0H21DRAFT_194977 [Amylocystis lapponica]|nr:hypothetical protein B0H21DRAFT_194977 [Amylocystis lapponica]
MLSGGVCFNFILRKGGGCPVTSVCRQLDFDQCIRFVRYFRRPSTPQYNPRSRSRSRSPSKYAQLPRRSMAPSPFLLHIYTTLGPGCERTTTTNSDNAPMASPAVPSYIHSPTSVMRLRVSWCPRPDRLRTNAQPLCSASFPLLYPRFCDWDWDHCRGPAGTVIDGCHCQSACTTGLLQTLAERRLVLENDEDDEDPIGIRKESDRHLSAAYTVQHICHERKRRARPCHTLSLRLSLHFLPPPSRSSMPRHHQSGTRWSECEHECGGVCAPHWGLR